MDKITLWILIDVRLEIKALKGDIKSQPINWP
jgi:hypothetical protein